MKQKTCKCCRQLFTPSKMAQKVCSPSCAIKYAEIERGKAEKRARIKEKSETKIALQKFKSKADWAKEAQTEFNKFIRARDADQPCISCGRYHTGQYHAGHYLSIGARPELRFDELNVHKQCSVCNNHLSGNAVLYRKALIEKIGAWEVELLEGPHEPARYTVDALQEIKQRYSAMAKQLKEMQA